MQLHEANRLHIIDLQAKYGSDAHIAALFGVTRQAVHAHRKALGVPVIKSLGERNAKIAYLHKTGQSIRVIASKMSMSKSNVARIVKEMSNV